MKLTKLALAVIVTPLVVLAASVQAETVRDCMLEGTVTRQQDDSDKVYVAFHSAKPAEKGASCNMRKRQKLQFKAPGDTDIKDAEPGSKVKYRYTEDSDKGATWKLQKVSS